MQTVDKAFELLGFFSEQRPQAGLSELAQKSGFDKATVHRLLLALARHGVVEQDPGNKRYRIGPGVLRLARLREATSPLASIGAPLLRALAQHTGETAHLTVLAGSCLSTIAVEESRHSNRVKMDLGEALPLHATASGMVVLAFADDLLLQCLRSRARKSYTGNTVTKAAELQTLAAKTRSDGYVIAKGWFETDVCSVAAPYFDEFGCVRGSIAVAAPSTRFSPQQQASIRSAVTRAAADMTTRSGGAAPAGIAG